MGDVSLGECALCGCAQLSFACFGPVAFTDAVFSGCEQLTAVNASRVVSVTKGAFVGSSVEAFAGGECPAECGDALEYVATPAGPPGEMVWRSDAEPVELTAMTRLKVLGRSLEISGEQRRFLAEMDLSAFDRLPAGCTLRESFGLKRVRFSQNLVEIPDNFFKDCSRLVAVNSGECLSLERIGKRAFSDCWKLRELIIPESCREVYVSFSGISSLDLRRSEATLVKGVGCHHMRRLCLLTRVACELLASSNPALSHMSLRVWPRGNDWGWACSMRPEEMRLFSMRAAPVLDSAGACCLSNAHVFADIGAVGERQSRPCMPC
jgi:hypothetical protein